ncbi:MAG: SMEK domain-containing protein, partial [bacterium]|nr:SMEK domain-containing protein [bacterium]
MILQPSLSSQGDTSFHYPNHPCCILLTSLFCQNQLAVTTRLPFTDAYTFQDCRGRRLTLQRQNLLEEAKRWLNRLELSIKSDTTLRHQDSHIEIETFFRDLLNLVFGWNLGNANTLIGSSQDSFDLSDRSEGIAVQVTVTTTAEKIRKTFAKFVRSHAGTFSRLVFVYPRIEIPKSRADFSDALEGFHFDSDKD